MADEEISYKTLRKIQQLEKNSPLLTKLDSNFYSSLSDYFKSLDNLAGKEADSGKSKLLHDEIQNTRKIAISIYEQREKKTVQVALSTTRGGKPDLKNLLDVEQKLYNSIVGLILQTRKEIIKEKQPLKDTNLKTNNKHVNSSKKNNPNPIVRITKDVPEFMGTDMKKYNLRKEDIISLPKEMTEPLKKRGVIKQIK